MSSDKIWDLKFQLVPLNMMDDSGQYSLVWNETTQSYERVPKLPQTQTYISDVKHECKCPFIRLLIVHAESCPNFKEYKK